MRIYGPRAGTGAPKAKTANVSNSPGVVSIITRLLGSASNVSLTTGTDSNFTLSGLIVSAITGIPTGTSQTYVVSEALGQVIAQYPVTLSVPGLVTLAALTLSNTTPTAGAAWTSTITGKTAGSTVTATSSDGTTITVTGTTLSATFSTAGTPTISLSEALAGATNTPNITTIGATVAAAPVSLGALSLSNATPTAGAAWNSTITGKTAGSTVTATSSDGTTITVTGTTLSGTFSTAGTPTISLSEALAGATNTPHVTTIGATVAAAPVTLGTLTLSSTAFFTGGATSVSIGGRTTGSTITATSSDGTTLTVSGNVMTGTFTAAGSPTISLSETLARATNTPHVTTIGATVTLAAASPYVSGGVRARMVAPYGGGNSTTVLQTTRLREISNAAGSAISVEFVNMQINTASVGSANPETAYYANAPTVAVQAQTLRAYVLTNLSGTGLNQSSATGTALTFNGAFAGTAGYIFKLDGTTPTSGDISAAIAANTLSLTDSNRAIQIPGGWRCRSDNATVAIGLRVPYMIQMETTCQTGGAYFLQTAFNLRPDLGDARKTDTVAGNAGNWVFQKDWTSAGASTTQSSAVYFPAMIHVVPTQAGAKSLALAGDSQSYGANDGLYGLSGNYGDVDGAFGYAARACNLARYPHYMSSMPGDAASTIYDSVAANGGLGDGQRALQHRYASVMLSGMGGNDRFVDHASGSAMTWTGAAPTGFLSLYRWYQPRMRSQMLAGSAQRLVGFTLMPHTSDGTLVALTSLSYDGNTTGTLVVPVANWPAGFVVGQQFRLSGTASLFTTTIPSTSYDPGVWTAATVSSSGGNYTVTFTTPTGMGTPPSSGTTIGDWFATTGGQAQNGGTLATDSPGINQYYSNPSAFVPSSGDPDAAYDLVSALQTLAPSNGFPNTAAQKWPANGTYKAPSTDGTHASASISAMLATNLASNLPSLVGFSPAG